MRHATLGGLLAAATVAVAFAAPPKAKVAADAPSAKPAVSVLKPGDPAVGKIKSDDERCQECHGQDGNADDIQDGVGNIGKFPRLAGQSFDYIVKQIRNFRSGERNHEVMLIMASAVSDRDLADIAAYFSGLPKMQGDGKGENAVGKGLFVNGDPQRNILPCVTCHGEGGKGGGAGGALTPVIGGQHARYLQKQLREWKAGERHNDPSGTMNAIAKQLTDAEIDALSEYLAGR